MFRYNKGNRPDPETIKREGWRDQGILVVSPADDRLTWPEKEMIKRLGEKLYGKSQHHGGTPCARN